MTLPEGVTTWQFINGFSLKNPTNFFVYPLLWEKGITDDFSVTFMPLPLEARYRVFRSRDGAAEWEILGSFLGQIVSRNKNFDWRPTFRSRSRYRLTPKFGLESELLALLEVTRDPIGNPGSTFGYKVQGNYQFSPHFMLGVGIWVARENGTTRAQYVGAIPLQNEGIASESMRVRFPIQINGQWSIAPQWDLKMESQVFRLGYDADYKHANLFVSVLHYW
ncbi:MAG: hypothetical protein JNL01_09405 [Bdellovibrionales bacterium]|nr:hypothetical protein [Bdellovibrionales bacterium]